MCWRKLMCGACGLGLLLAGPALAQTMFTEVTKESGYPPFGAEGIAAGDFNNDGWPDLAMTENNLDGVRVLLLQNQGQGRFADLTAAIQSPISLKSKGGGLCFADYDNDGDLDLFVPVGHVQFPPNVDRDMLLRNDRGTFTDVAREAGLTEVLPSYDATWLDYDRDGHLDLYVGHYLELHMPGGVVLAGDPTLRNRLYHNRGDGTFEDRTQQSGLDLQLSIGGGSVGGFAADDFDNDGWPDLYVGVLLDRNRLFLNDRQGHFRDVTTPEIGDQGEAFGVAVGDIDDDGDLDIFQTGGGNPLGFVYRSLLLLNLGEARFLDVTEGVGLKAYFARNTGGAGLVDLDNDGHLDLMTAIPSLLHLNRGDGTFADQTAHSGIDGDTGNALAFGDYDLDGFLDVVFGTDSTYTKAPSFGRLYRNNRNDNHYLQVETVGLQSNRTGIGARLIATVQRLKQIREIGSSNGPNQHEMTAHFGLGTQIQVDTLEVRWPSGQVDVLTDVPADQKIRVLEGSGRYYHVEPTRWQQAPPETLVAGTTPHLNLAVKPALFDPEAHITRVTADLSSLGGAAEVALTEEDDSTYQLRDFPLPAIALPNGAYTLHVMVDQQTSLGPYWTRLSRKVVVVPAGDLVIFGDEAGAGWQVQPIGESAKLDLQERQTVYQGKEAMKVEANAFTVDLLPAAPVDPVGYRALRLAFHPGDAVAGFRGAFNVAVKTVETNPNPFFKTDPLYVKLLYGSQEGLRLNMDQKGWQVVEIPLEAFGAPGKIQDIRLLGSLKGAFYLDDIRLVAASPPPPTVVQEERTASLPHTFSLSQNFPNPFNSDTVIRFALPEGGEVELAVYNLAGQQVVKLAEGVREAGSYTMRWDGRDARGKELASGVYLYRLRAGEKMEAQKLLLLR